MPGVIRISLSSPKTAITSIVERKIVAGFAGPPGEPGTAGGKEIYTAGSALSSGRLVTALNNTANYFDPAGNYEPVGITQNAALTGDQVTVVMSGPVTISGWGLTPGAKYFAGPNGTLLSNPLLCTGRTQQVGIAEDADTLILNIKQAIKI